jgi:two-component system, sensor histidine kinase SagS
MAKVLELTVPDQSRFLILDGPDHAVEAISQRPQAWEWIHARNLPHLLTALREGPFAGFLVDPNIPGVRDELGRMAQAQRILETLDIGIAIVDSNWCIEWANCTFQGWCEIGPLGKPILQALGDPVIRDGDPHPFDTASSGLSARFRLFIESRNRYLESHLSPLLPDGGEQSYVIQCRDITARVQQQQKLDALHQAGSTLAGLDPEQLEEMPVETRIKLLKKNLLKSIHEVLKYEVIEIRMLDRRTNKLEPLVAEGMSSEAEVRDLYALAEGNGVTGFVAATRHSYLCTDASTDPHYIKGAEGARSSMTVPLMIQDQVIGTFNVESPSPNAFGPDDLQFAELFAREIARALYTLELLNAQRICSVSASLTAVNKEIALPVDTILTTACRTLSNYMGLPDDVKTALKRVVDQARQVKANILKVGAGISPTRPAGNVIDGLSPTRLKGLRVLVVDASEEFRSNAHSVLEHLGCIVETAETVGEALTLAPVSTYDAVILDVKPPDMKGFDAFMRLREAHPNARIIMMVEFGYDGEHTLVKCRQAGLKFVLFKPFMVNQLVQALDGPEPTTVQSQQPRAVTIS